MASIPILGRRVHVWSATLQMRLRGLVNRNTVYQNLMFVFCILFGLALIADTHLPGDGLWYWYAYLMHSGHHLYSDMHLPLQPLFVLETSWFMSLLGKSWLACRVPGVLHAVAYALGLLLLVRNSTLRDGEKAIVLGTSFFVSIFSPLYRFDDYHVFSDCFTVYSLVVLLMLMRSESERRSMVLTGVLGVLSGLAIANRLNDGGAVFLAVAVAVLCMAPFRRYIALVLFCVVAALTLLLIVSLTGDSIRDYAMNSILHAAASKGGTGHVLKYPIHLPVNTWRWLRATVFREAILYGFAVGLVWAYLLRPVLRRQRWQEILKAAVGAGLIALSAHHVYPWFTDSILYLDSMAAAAVFVVYGLGTLVFLRWQFAPRRAVAWDRREILFLMPLWQQISLSTSSGGYHFGLYLPLALLIALIAVVSPVRLRFEAVKHVLLAVCTLLFCSAVYYKYEVPYLWHSYRSLPLFEGRQWYRHPVYGPMIIEREQLKFILPVCAAIGGDGAKAELLSLPYPYANYFCDVPPWHGYVQTFFDTSSSETIFGLMDELQKAPPQWVFYERQLDSLSAHEGAYNRGQPLPHRYLDQMIEQKLADGSWQAVYRSNFGNSPQWSNEWILIRTRP